MEYEVEVPSLFSSAKTTIKKHKKLHDSFDIVVGNSKYEITVHKKAKKCRLKTRVDITNLTIDEVSSFIDDLTLARNRMAELTLERLLQSNE